LDAPKFWTPFFLGQSLLLRTTTLNDNNIPVMTTVDDEFPRVMDKQQDNNLIAILNVLLLSKIASLVIFMSNDDDIVPAEIVRLKTGSEVGAL